MRGASERSNAEFLDMTLDRLFPTMERYTRVSDSPLFMQMLIEWALTLL
jgi:hypothetical protein